MSVGRTKTASSRAGRLTVSRPALLVDGADTPFRFFIHDFLAFSARVAQIRAGFGEAIGLTGIAYTTLMSIAHLQGESGVGVAQLADHIHLSGAFTTIEVAKLVKAGLVEKRVNTRDRRRVLLTVAPQGRDVLQRLRSLQVPVNDALFECLTAADFDRLRRMVGDLVACGERAIALQRDLIDEDRPTEAPALATPRLRSARA